MWPVRRASGCICGYDQITIWFCEYPCVDTISLTFLDHDRLHTGARLEQQPHTTTHSHTQPRGTLRARVNGVQRGAGQHVAETNGPISGAAPRHLDPTQR